VIPHFDRFDICEAWYCLGADYNVGGWIPERMSNRRLGLPKEER
jgi:hypothetical protein